MAGRKFQASIQAGKLVLEAGTVSGNSEASLSFETRWTGKGYIEGGLFYEQVEAVPDPADLIFLSVGEEMNRGMQAMKECRNAVMQACMIPGWVQNPFGRKPYPGFIDQAYLDSLKAFKAEYLCSPYNEQDIRATNSMYGTVTGRMSASEHNPFKWLRPSSPREWPEGRDMYSQQAERMVKGWEFKGDYPKLTIEDRRQIIKAFNETFNETGDRECARNMSRKEYRRIMFAKARQIVKQVYFTEAYGGRSKIGGISSPNAQRVAPDFLQKRCF